MDEKQLLKRWLFVAIYVVVLFLFSGQPASGAAPMSDFVSRWFPGFDAESLKTAVFYLRKTGHVIGYAAVTVLLLRAVTVTRSLRSRPYLASGVIALMLAVADESYQAFLPHRSGQFGDVVFDTVGILCALGGLYLYQRAVGRRATMQGSEPKT
jgi:VanZ family protein